MSQIGGQGPSTPHELQLCLSSRGASLFLPSEVAAAHLIALRTGVLNRVDEMLSAIAGMAVFAALRLADANIQGAAGMANKIVGEYTGISDLISIDESLTFKVARAICSLRRLHFASVASAYLTVAGGDSRKAVDLACEHVIIVFVYEMTQTLLSFAPKIDTNTLSSPEGQASLLGEFETAARRALPGAVPAIGQARMALLPAPAAIAPPSP